MSPPTVGQILELPPDEIGQALLAAFEDQWFDRKSIRVSQQALANLAVGMANADGGTIIIGLADGVEGTDHEPQKRNRLVQALVDLTVPSVRAHDRLVPCLTSSGEASHLLVVEVATSEIVHANNRDEVFLRVGDQNRRLTYRQRRELEYDRGQAVFETTPVPDITLDDLDPSALDQYAEAVGHPDPERLLVARGLVSDGVISAGGALLFGVDPQRHFPEAYVRVLRYRGSTRGTGRRQQLVEDIRCEGAVPRQIEEARAAISALQPTRSALGAGGRFEDVGMIPEDVWLEGLVNGVIHRSYSLAGDHIRIEIFDDRIEIESPGRFPGLAYDGDPLRATRFARNPRIARACAELRFGQELGEGIRRMFQEMRLAGLADPQYRQTAGSVRLRLLALPVDPEREARLPSHARDILSLLRQAGRLSTGDIEDALGLSRPIVLDRLKVLREEGLVAWVGRSPKDPRAYWKLP